MMDDRLIRGIPWTLLSFGANKVLTLTTTILVARLLAPEDFGIVALATLAVTFLSLFSGLGLGATLVLRQDLDERQQGTVLTLLLASGAIAAGLMAAAAPLVAELFDEPRLSGVLAAMAAIIFFGGFTWFYESLLQRELEFRKRFITQTVRAVSYSVVTLLLAVLGAGVWSLVGGQLAMFLGYGAALAAMTPYRVTPAFDGEVARDAIRTGSGFVVQGGAAFMQQNLDYVAIGGALGARPLGLYSMAYQQAELPAVAIANPVANVTFPGFARMRQRGEDILPAFLTALRGVALAAAPFAIVLSGAAEPLTEVILGEQWLPMVGALAILGIRGAVRPIETTLGWLLNSVGEARALGRVSIVSLLPLAAAVVLIVQPGGITAVSWAMLAHAAGVLAVLMALVARRTGLSVSRQARALAPLAVACALSWVATRGVAETLSSSSSIVALAGSAGAGFAAYLGVVVVLDRRLLTDMSRLARRAAGAPALGARSA